MAVTHTQQANFSTAGTTPSLIKTVQRTATGEQNISKSIAGSTTNQLEAFVAPTAKTHSVYMVADQDCTVKTNSSSAPDKTISLKKNEPVVFWDVSGMTNPFGAVDVASLYVTTGVNTTQLEIRAAVDV
jgi:hypothetical protein